MVRVKRRWLPKQLPPPRLPPSPSPHPHPPLPLLLLRLRLPPPRSGQAGPVALTSLTMRPNLRRASLCWESTPGTIRRCAAWPTTLSVTCSSALMRRVSASGTPRKVSKELVDYFVYTRSLTHSLTHTHTQSYRAKNFPTAQRTSSRRSSSCPAGAFSSPRRWT